MAEPRARVFEYDVAYDGEGRATAQDSTIDIPQEWAPEHLVLAGLVDCSVTSLRYHAKREGIEVQARAATQAGPSPATPSTGASRSSRSRCGST